jgi:FlaA1/EpsC-like NDP-sugar epimerase
LILQTSKLAVSSVSVLTLDMGQPVSIRELAEQMIHLSGRTAVNPEIEIIYTGLRPGEKLHETIFHPDESYQRTSNARVFKAEPRLVDVASVLRIMDRLDSLLRESRDDRLFKAFLHETVSDYHSPEDKVVSLAQARALAKR